MVTVDFTMCEDCTEEINAAKRFEEEQIKGGSTHFSVEYDPPREPPVEDDPPHEPPAEDDTSVYTEEITTAEEAITGEAEEEDGGKRRIRFAPATTVIYFRKR
jgi:hypothetical protein